MPITNKIKITLIFICLILLLKKESFQINNPKLIEPVYTGNPHSPYYQSDISPNRKKKVMKYDNEEEYKKAIQNYCETDCMALYQVLIKFRSMIYFNSPAIILANNLIPNEPALAK